MSDSGFYSYLFAGETLFLLDSERFQPAKTESVTATAESAEKEIAPTEVTPIVSAVQPGSISPQFPVQVYINTYGKEMEGGERDFLGRVLKAVNLEYDRVDLTEVNPEAVPGDVFAIPESNLVTHVLLLGVKPAMIGWKLSLKPYEPALIDGIWYLLSNSPLRISMELSLRKDLWQALKQMFVQENGKG